MNYELAKQLKDAGFPQNHHNSECSLNDCYMVPCPKSKPTLSELIEACVGLSESGDFHLERNSLNSKEDFSGWGASVDCFKLEPYISGKTPEEAVARLWLALNPHKDEKAS